MSLSRETSFRHQLFGAWCAPIFSLFTIVGWMLIAQGLDPAPASWSAEKIADFFASHHDRILIGVALWSIGCIFLAVWTVQLSIHLWQLEGRRPLWAGTQALSGFGIVVFVTLSCCLWASAAFRPGEYSPETVEVLNDAAWLALLLPWPILTLQMVSTAVVALHDRRQTPVFPRWLSWISIVEAVAMVMLAGSAFTHTGLFAFDGILGYFVPMGMWGFWLNAHAWYMRRELLRERADETVEERDLPELAMASR